MGRWLVIACIIGGAAWLALPARDARASWQLMNVTGYLPDLRFSLVNDQGQAVTAAHYRGDVVLLYFGFTGCAEQCPLTLARLSQIVQQSGAAGNAVRVLFVTVNPQNDTPPVLRHYLASFDAAHMVGLTGSDDNIAALARRLRAAYRPAGNDTPHSAAVYIFDRSGAARLIMTPEDADGSIVHDITQLTHDAG